MHKGIMRQDSVGWFVLKLILESTIVALRIEYLDIKFSFLQTNINAYKELNVDPRAKYRLHNLQPFQTQSWYVDS